MENEDRFAEKYSDLEEVTIKGGYGQYAHNKPKRVPKVADGTIIFFDVKNRKYGELKKFSGVYKEYSGLEGRGEFHYVDENGKKRSKTVNDELTESPYGYGTWYTEGHEVEAVRLVLRRIHEKTDDLYSEIDSLNHMASSLLGIADTSALIASFMSQENN